MTSTAPRRAGVLVAAGSLLLGLLVSAPSPASAAEGDLQPFFTVTQPTTPAGAKTTGQRISVTELPMVVTLSLTELIPRGGKPTLRNLIYRFQLRLPETVFQDTTLTVTAINDDGTRVLTGSVPVLIPAGTDCSTYEASVKAFSGEAYTATGAVQIVGCPREFTARQRYSVKRDGGPVTVQLAGHYFPNRRSRFSQKVRDVGPIELRVDGTVRDTVIGDTSRDENLSFDRRLPMVLSCGPHVATAVALALAPEEQELGRATFERRCPALVLDRNVVDSTELPTAVKGLVSGLEAKRPFQLLLDGKPAGNGTTDTPGRGSAPVALPAGTACGPHTVQLVQAPVPRTFPGVDPVRPNGTDAGFPPSPGLRAAAGPIADLLATAALTIRCTDPLAPVLDVRPEVISAGFAALVTGQNLRPGPVQLAWDLDDGTRIPAQRRLGTVLPDGTLRLSLLVLRGEPLGRRTLVALQPDGPTAGTVLAADPQGTLVVASSVQPGRRQQGVRLGLLGRR